MERKFKVKLGNQDINFKRYWEPFPEIESYLNKYIKPKDKVLEIGPGSVPFQQATHYIGFDEGESKHYPNFTKCDVSLEKIPFPDNHFDFVYCRHVLEDISNPMGALDEIQRTCKKGYLETPSPLSEIWDFAEAVHGDYKGYSHHRYFLWNDGKLNIMAKYPLVEKITFNKTNVNELLEEPYNWITPFFFDDKINWKLHQHGWNKEFMVNKASTYTNCINQAIAQSIKQSKHFKEVIKNA